MVMQTGLGTQNKYQTENTTGTSDLKFQSVGWWEKTVQQHIQQSLLMQIYAASTYSYTELYSALGKRPI